MHILSASSIDSIVSSLKLAKSSTSSTNKSNVMVDEEITKEATEIFTKLGFDMNTAINIFLRSAIRKKGIPFDLLVD